MSAFTRPLDIAKRALQLLGQPTIGALTDSSQQAVQMNYCYPFLRQAELRRAAWTFAARRAVLRARTTTVFRVTFLAWASGTTYAVGDIVSDTNGYLWLSVRATNIGNSPMLDAGSGGFNPYWVAYSGPTAAELWASGNYFPGDVVYKTGSPAKAYIAVLGPPSGAAITTQDPVSGTPWHEIAGATVAAMANFEPQGYSIAPSAAVTTATLRNIYDLPANFMRLAPQDVKTAATPRAFVTDGQQFNDWEIEGDLIYSASTGPIIFRFTADVTNIAAAKPLFCELVALSMAKNTCMILTGSRELEAQLERRYDDLANDARTVDLTEAGSTELEPRPQQPQAQPAGRGG